MSATKIGRKYLLSGFFCLYVVLLSQVVHAQAKTFTIIYDYKDSTGRKLGDSFYFKLVKPFYYAYESFKYPVKQASFKVTDSVTQATVVYEIKDTSSTLILDGFGHQSFIIPGDTVVIHVSSMTKVGKLYMLNNKYVSSWFHQFEYACKNKFVYGLFDSIAFHTGPLNTSRIGFLGAMTLPVFFDTVTQVYQNRISFLEAYSVRHNIPDNIRQLATVEIKSAYIVNLLYPIIGSRSDRKVSDLPKEYLDVLNDFDFKNEMLFNKTVLYKDAVYMHNYNCEIKAIAGVRNKEEEFEKGNEYIEKYYSGDIRNYLMFSNFGRAIKGKIESFGSLLAQYKEKYNQEEAFNYLDSCYAVEKNKPVTTFEQALATKISDAGGNSHVVKDMLKKRPALIDCWASWCAPCLREMPYAKQLEKEYKGKIDFVYLSYDRDSSAWKKKLQELKLKPEDCYLLDKNFNSDFAYHFSVTSIPRYILIGKDGNVVSVDAPRPSHTVNLKKILDGLL